MPPFGNFEFGGGVKMKTFRLYFACLLLPALVACEPSKNSENSGPGENLQENSQLDPTHNPSGVSNNNTESTYSLPSPIMEPAPILGDIERDRLGDILLTDQFRIAQAICAKAGKGLPTAREYALFAVTLGAMAPLAKPPRDPWAPRPRRECGLDHHSVRDPLIASGYHDLTYVHSLYPMRDMVTGGYRKCLAVDFYYNFEGYQPPANEVGEYEFWTRTEVPSLSYASARGSGIYYSFFGKTGWIRQGRRSDLRAIRCVNK